MTDRQPTAGRQDPRIGTTLGAYRIDALVGRGGMGIVYLAEHVHLGQSRALKVLTAELGADASFRERFVRESRMAASLNHPNIIPIHDAGEVSGELYIAMHYVRGTDLRTVLLREGPLDPARTMTIIAQVGAALDAAHAQGLVHRDVKPGNILLEEVSDRIYLTDFGLTKLAGTEAGLTRTGQFVGTVDYIAPEQAEGRPVDARTDVYSLGCVTYECLTGAAPFGRPSEVAVILAHLREPPPAVSTLRPELAALDPVIARALAKAPEHRFQTCAGLVAAARDALAVAWSAGTPAETRVRTEAAPPFVAPAETSHQARPPEPYRPPQPFHPEAAPQATDSTKVKRRLIGGLAAVVVLSTIAAVVAFVVRGEGSSPSFTIPTPEPPVDLEPSSLFSDPPGNCEPTSASGQSVAALKCKGDITSYHYRYATRAAMHRQYEIVVRVAQDVVAVSPDSGDCESRTPGEHQWSGLGGRGGRVICYDDDDFTWIRWTDESTNVYSELLGLKKSYTSMQLAWKLRRT